MRSRGRNNAGKTGSAGTKRFLALTITAIMLVFATGCQMKAAQVEQKVQPRPGPVAQPQVSAISDSAGMAASGAAKSSSRIGLSTGGAKDIGNFRENIAKGFLPLPTDIAYEGLYYDYYFDTGAEQPCKELFCPSYSTALSKDPFSGKDEYFLSVGLNSGIEQKDFARKRLRLMLVLDISGSMESPFDAYYYDGTGRGKGGKAGADADRDRNKTKMAVASEATVALLDHLNDGDSFGMVVFDDSASVIQPMKRVADTDIGRVKREIMGLKTRGGTNMSSGIDAATKQLAKFTRQSNPEFENRIIFLTDAMPNQGATSDDDLLGITETNAAKKIYSTFVGVGVDFNTDLVQRITKIRGANYYSVHSPAEFKDRMDDGFDYMVTPLVFDLKLSVNAPGFKIEEVYGSPEADESSGELMKVNTLFPSDNKGGETRGGLVLLHMKRIQPDDSVTTGSTVKLTVSYEERGGARRGNTSSVELGAGAEHYDNTGIRKGIALARYASILRNWLMDERRDLPEEAPDPREAPNEGPTALNDSLKNGTSVRATAKEYRAKGIPLVDPKTDLGTWERRSAKLQVSSEYKAIFRDFAEYFDLEIAAIGDKTMGRESKVLRELAE